VKRQIAGALFALTFVIGGVFPAAAGEWELSEDGKHWMYCTSPGNPVEDQWLEVDGKIYYLDAKGYMKTGWVTDKEKGEKYYMGPDGAMCHSVFSDNDRYVGADGTQVKAYDTYRKAVKSELKKTVPKKKKAKSKNTEVSDEPPTEQRFLLTDLNLDGYRDLVVVHQAGADENLVEVAVWEPEEEVFQLAAEFDAPDEGEHTALYLDPEGEAVWLEITQRGGDLSLFQMLYTTTMFESVWNFTMELDDWGGPEYQVNGSVEDKETWDADMAEALGRRGDVPLTGYLPATEENIKEQVDRILTEEEEQDLWR